MQDIAQKWERKKCKSYSKKVKELSEQIILSKLLKSPNIIKHPSVINA